MVATYRCNELKEEAVALVRQDIINFEVACNAKQLDSFQDTSTQVLKKAFDYYDDVARQYDKTVFKKVKQELADQLLQSLFLCFDAQLKMLRQYQESKVQTDIKKLETKDLD